MTDARLDPKAHFDGMSHREALALHLPEDPMGDVETLPQLLQRRARLDANRVACHFGEESRTYAELWAEITAVAAWLHQKGFGADDRLVLVLPNDVRFFAAYYGCQHLGGTAVPIFHDSGVDRITAIAQACGTRGILTLAPLQESTRATIREQLAKTPFFTDLNEILDGAPPLPEGIPGARPDGLAMLQYTSGTTGDSKGVMLTHANLLANLRQMIVSAAFRPDDVFVSWLPVYHDMGLITMTMCPFYLGAKLVLLPVSLKPSRWLKAIEQYGGTMTAAPDFAYRFATKFTKANHGLDLSSLRVALIAAEPIRASTVERFEQKFGLHGVVKPGYGLAEASVAAAFWDLNQKEIIADENGFVCSGYPLAEMDLAIATPEGPTQQAGVIGEILMRGPSCTAGYYRNEEATKSLHERDGYIRTGDMGYLDAHCGVYIIGRAKNIIIRAGRNFAPRELEEIAEELAQVKKAAAIGIDSGDLEGESIHLFAEVNKRTEPDALAALAEQLVKNVHAEIGIRPNRVHLVVGKTIPITYNGKVKYTQLKQEYEAGLLESRQQILWQ